MPVHDSLLDLVGGTPLVRLNRITAGLRTTVYAKLEYLNPGGSVKDRAAATMVAAAEQQGALRPGGTIVEASSGNTGIGLAQIAAVRGYRLVVVLPETVAREKIDILRAYGAEAVLTRSGVPREHPEHAAKLAESIAARTPGAWHANQYDNLANPLAHRVSTGPEIWADTGGRITHLVAGIGTGGTISGTGAHLKDVSGGRVQVIGADPATSRYNGGDGSPFLVEAAGHYLHSESAADTWPRSYHTEVLDRIEAIADRESVRTVGRLAREEGLLVGGSSGLAVAAALRVARGLGPEHTVVVVLPDSGRAYLSKYHSPDWLRRLGFLDDDRDDLLADALGAGPVRSVTTRTPLAEAAALVRGADRDLLLPVVLPGRNPRWATAVSEVLGAITPGELLAAAERRDGDVPVGEVAGPPPLALGTGETVDEAVTRLDAAGAEHAVLLRDGRLAGIVTRTPDGVAVTPGAAAAAPARGAAADPVGAA